MRWNDRVTLILVCFLTGCATTGGSNLPPAEFLQDCGTIPGKPATNRELVKQREALIADLRACNRDKSNLREWVKEQK